jgi:hypothetical protein
MDVLPDGRAPQGLDPKDAGEPAPDAENPDTGGPDSESPDSDASRPAEAGEGGAFDPPSMDELGHQELDLGELDGEEGFRRIYGPPEGNGSLGVPVAGSKDLDGDGEIDFAFASFQASPLDRAGTGQVAILFGDGAISGDIDLAEDRDDVLMVYGDGPSEGTGSEVWMDDVTGDGIGDLLIARQNYRAADPDRIGAGALTILVGGAALRAQLVAGEPIDLRTPPAGLTVVTFVGGEELGRFGIWMRTGDVTGEGVADIVVGADQESLPDEDRRGAMYVIRGGSHLAVSRVIDLGEFGATELVGHIAKVTPPLGESAGYHFGATVTIADLDRNGRGEVLGAAALIRSGASYRADGAPAGSAEYQGGAPGGRVYIAWDDNFPAGTWPAGYTFDVSQSPGAVTALLSGSVDELSNRRLGEELLGGADYDGDGRPDLFVGDMTGLPAGGRGNGGMGFVVYDAGALRGVPSVVLLDPGDVPVAVIQGPSAGGITADTATHGDFDGDGIADLAIASPNVSPAGRVQAGAVHILWGNPTRWPARVDLANKPLSTEIQITDVWGALGANGSDGGDMLAYSADAGDVDGDGLDDLILNEMGGNGTSVDAIDAGNLLIVSGALASAGRPDCSGVLSGDARIDSCGRCAGGGTTLQPDQGCVQFGREIQPLLLGECGQCHGNSGSLSMFSHELLMLGTSDHGPVVIPGAPERSLLVLKLRDEASFGDPMPPDYRLSSELVDLVARWVAEGARDN